MRVEGAAYSNRFYLSPSCLRRVDYRIWNDLIVKICFLGDREGMTVECYEVCLEERRHLNLEVLETSSCVICGTCQTPYVACFMN